MAPEHDTSGPLPAHAVAQYREEQVNHLGQKELLLMLYDGALRFCEEARSAIESKDNNTSYQKLVRVRDIVIELMAILDPEVEADVVTNLRRLYDFCIYGVTEVNFTKDLDLLDAVMGVLRTLRNTWDEIDFDAAMNDLREEAGLPIVAAPPAPAPVAAPAGADESDAPVEESAHASGGFSLMG